MQQTPTRRTVLRRTGAIATAGTLASVAGCLDCPPLLCDRPVDPATWVAAPDVLLDGAHDDFTYVDYETLFEYEDELNDAVQDTLDAEDRLSRATDVDRDDRQVELFYATVRVVRADFNQDDVIEELENNAFDAETEHEGYTIMLAADDSDFAGQAIGVSEETLISGRPTGQEDAPEDVVEIAIDVGNGTEDRYVDENDDFDELLSAMSNGTFDSGGTNEELEEPNEAFGRFEGVVARGGSYTVSGETTDVEFVWVYDRDGDVDTGDVEDYIETSRDEDRFWDDVDEVDVNQNGRVATATGQIDTDDFRAEE